MGKSVEADSSEPEEPVILESVQRPPDPEGCRQRSKPGGCKEWSLVCRVLPDGRVIHLVPQLFNVRLVIEEPADNEAGCYTDGWCFDKTEVVDAVMAAASWEGQGDPPGRWKKHVTTGRRGPGVQPRADGDEA